VPHPRLAASTLALCAALPQLACDRGPAAAGPPRLIGEAVAVTLRSREEYDRQNVRRDGALALARLPAELSAAARFGTLVCRDGTFAVVVDGEAEGRRVIVDLDRDGDLTGDPSAPLAAASAGQAAALEGAGRVLHLEVLADQVVLRPRAERRGTVRAGGAAVAFALEGYCGRYDLASSAVAFDLDADGTADASPLSDERFEVRDRLVRLHDKTFEFTVEPAGAWLRLKRSKKEEAPPRASLADGAPAPDFSARDVRDGAHRLADYRGRPVLLHFWATWSERALAEMPRLAGLRAAHPERALVILGLAEEESSYPLLAYMARNDVGWPQIVQGRDAPVRRAYRVPSVPLCVLIDREGKIAGKGSLDDLAPRVDALARESRS